jgi:hypothetical protein
MICLFNSINYRGVSSYRPLYLSISLLGDQFNSIKHLEICPLHYLFFAVTYPSCWRAACNEKTLSAVKSIWTVYCVLCTACCVFCTVYCVLCTVYCVLCTVLCTVYCVLCTVYCVPCRVHCVLCTVYCVLCTVYCTVYSALCTVYCVLLLCTVYCVLCTVYCVLCTVYCVLCRRQIEPVESPRNFGTSFSLAIHAHSHKYNKLLF